MSFRSWSYALKHKEMLVVYPIGIMLYEIVSVIDQYVAPEAYREVLVPLHRYILPLLLVSVLLALYRKKSQTFLNYHISLNAMFAMGVNSVIISSIELFTIYHTVMYFVILWTFLFAGLTLKHALITVFVGTVFNVIGISFCSELTSAEFWFHLFWIVASTIFGAAGNVMMYYSHKNQYMQQLQLQNALKQRGVLLKELAHRVKNNLQMVSGILYSQSRKIKDTTERNIFNESIQTIGAMGKLHEKLYTDDENVGMVDFKRYIEDIFKSLQQSALQRTFAYKIMGDNLVIKLNYAMPLGLILNEIITNALKHAKLSEDEILTMGIDIKNVKGEPVLLHIFDNGRDVDIDSFVKGYGSELIFALAKQQLKGDIKMYEDGGLHYVLTFSSTF